ncbi:MAG: glucose-1-phosphate adenylyltransferase [Lachnospirales bacterium]
MRRKEMIAMLLAGGQGSRLGILTKNKAKPGVAFGGMYRIIDFPLSNCVNSGVDTVGVLTQYEPLTLNKHIGIGIPWDLDKPNGGVTVLAPYVKGETDSSWYTGTANAIYQNINYIDSYNPKYILVLSGDHIYKMDYSEMLRKHKKSSADATIAVLEVPIEEASRFGIMNTTETGEVYEFEEKPENPKSNLASMGIYIFTWKTLRKYLISDNEENADSDFGKHIIPKMLADEKKLFTYTFDTYWRDVGTIESYWQANMDLIKIVPDLNLFEENLQIYTEMLSQSPHYISEDATVHASLVSDGCEIFGELYNSIIGSKVTIGKNSIIKDSIILGDTIIGENCVIERTIIDEKSIICDGVKIGIGDNIPNEEKPSIYNTGITVIGEKSNVPSEVIIGKNCVLMGDIDHEDFENNFLESGKTLIVNTNAKRGGK